VQFAEFERLIYDMAERGEPLTPDALSQCYYELNKTYYGPNVDPDRRISLEWSRIPHFYYGFYVYKYATGFSAAVALSEGILAGDKERIEAYLGFLRAGSSKDPLDILKEAGVDMSRPEPITSGLSRFSQTVEELKGSLLP
jgi:oligoendopeptidase F